MKFHENVLYTLRCLRAVQLWLGKTRLHAGIYLHFGGRSKHSLSLKHPSHAKYLK